MDKQVDRLQQARIAPQIQGNVPVYGIKMSPLIFFQPGDIFDKLTLWHAAEKNAVAWTRLAEWS